MSAPRTSTVFDGVEDVLPDVESVYQDVHRHPELSMQEARTARLAAQRLPDRITIIVEHDMDLVMSLCDNIIVMHHGKLLFQGTPAEVQASPDVQLAYLGTANDIDDIRAAAQDRRAQLGIRARRRS